MAPPHPTEAKLLWRDPASILVPLGLPVVVLMMGGFAANDPTATRFGGSFDAAVVPSALVMIVGMIGLLNLPTFLVERRRDRWLRRLAVTPARPVMLVSSVGPTTRVRRIARRLDRARNDTLATHGINAATLDLLATLRRSGSPYRLDISELHRRCLVSAGAISMRVDRAEEQGLVRRRRDTDDQRRVLVELTRQGAAMVGEVVENIATSERELLPPLNEDHSDALDHVLRCWLAHLEDS